MSWRVCMVASRVFLTWHTHSRQTQPKLQLKMTFLLNIFIWNLYTSKQLKDIVIIPDVHIYKYILVSQTSWVVQTGLNHWGPSAQHFDWHTANNRVISFLASSIVTWKINYVPSMCGRQEGSAWISLFMTDRLWHIYTPRWPLNTSMWVTVALATLHAGVAPPAEAGDDPTGQCQIM